jgi:hypothetical protein
MARRLKGEAYVLRSSAGKYVWNDPANSLVPMPTCDDPRNASRYVSEEDAEKEGRRIFRSEFRKSFIVPI